MSQQMPERRPPAGERVSMSRSIAIRALSDAIDWEQSFLDSHEPSLAGAGCCVHGARCEAYEAALKVYKQFRQTYKRITGKEYYR